MATLFNTKISATYEGLLKTIDNAAISATLRELTDGSGNQSGLYLNTAGDFKVTNVLEWGSLKDTGTGVTITRFVTSTDGIQNFDNNTSLPTSAAVKLYVDTKFASSDTLEEVLAFGNTTGGNDIAVSANDDITFTDSSKAIFGAGSDLQIYHESSNFSYIKHNSSSDFRIQTSSTGYIKLMAELENMAVFIPNSAVELYFDNSKKLETTNTGAEVTGDLLVTGTITGAGGSFLPLAGGTMTGNIVLNDNVKSIYGAGSDLEIFHSGIGDFIISKGTYNIFEANNHIFRNLASNEDYAKFIGNGAVELYYDNSKKFETTTDGTLITGGWTTTGNSITYGNIEFPDGRKAQFGTSQDLKIYHDGSHSYINESGTGALKILASQLEINNPANSENIATFTQDGAVQLYYDAVKRLETLTDGAKVTGNLEVTGTITGAGGSFLPLIGGTMTGDTIHNDNVKSIYGTASDGLEIYHDSLNSVIRDSGTGNLVIAADDFRVQVSDQTANMITANTGAEVNLMYNGGTKLATTNTGIAVTGNGVFTGNVNIPDAGKVQLGTNQDFLLYHNGNDAIARNYTGGYFIDQAAVTESITVRVSNANALDTTALIISRNGDLTTGRDVTIAGDLTVNGTTTTVNSQTLSVDDPLISLAINNAANSLDIGYYGKYNDGTTRYLGLYNDASDSNKFKLFKGTTVEPTTTVDIGGAGYVAADLVLAGLVAEEDIEIRSGNKLILQRPNNGVATEISTDVAGTMILNSVNDEGFKLQNAGTTILEIGNVSPTGATFAGDVKIAEATNKGQLFFGTADTNYEIKGGGNYGYLSLNAPILRFDTAGSERMRIDNSGNATFAGNVAINGSLLELGSFNQFSGIDTSDLVLSVDKNNAGGGSSFDIQMDGATSAFYINNSRNVGIGTTSIGAVLNYKILSLNGSGGDGGYLRFYSDDVSQAGIYSNATGFNFVAEGATYQRFYTNGSERMRIDTNGNVGIGTDSPSEKLEVDGAALIGDLRLVSTGSADYIQSDSNIKFSPVGQSTGTRMTILSTGNVGIGTESPDTALDVVGGNANSVVDTLTLKNDSTGNSAGAGINFVVDGVNDVVTSAIYGQRTGPSYHQGSLQFLTKDSSGGGLLERMRITSGGNVGIGTDSPAVKLDVSNGIARTVDTKTYSTFVHSKDSDDYRIGLVTTVKGGATASDRYVSLEGSSYQISTDTFTNEMDLVLNPTSGNVGIGTDSPNVKLHVKETSAVNTVIFENSGQTYNYTAIKVAEALNNKAVLSFAVGDALASTDILSEISGNVINNGGALKGDLVFKTNSGDNVQEKMRITSAGNVGIGSGNPQNKLDIEQSAAVSARLLATGATSSSLKLEVKGGATQLTTTEILANSSGALTFATGTTAASEKMRITSGGRVYINSNSYSRDAFTMIQGDSTTYALGLDAPVLYAGAYRYQSFFSGSNIAGTISGNTTTSVSYNTSSDYRMKKNIKPLENGLKRLCELKPVKFDWKENDSSTEGFIAHEVQEIFPDAISGEKDGELMQGMDYGRITPLLVKAIQELTAKVERLEAK